MNAHTKIILQAMQNQLEEESIHDAFETIDRILKRRIKAAKHDVKKNGWDACEDPEEYQEAYYSLRRLIEKSEKAFCTSFTNEDE